MTKLAVDAPVLLELVRSDRPLGADVSLVGPAALKSQAMDLLLIAARAEGLPDAEVRRILTRLAEVKVRLLGDRVSRQRAYRLAVETDAASTAPMEYVAVATLQADALVTEDPALVAAAEGRVRVAAVGELYASPL